jgi:uncharacterized spore protein YtfJ
METRREQNSPISSRSPRRSTTEAPADVTTPIEAIIRQIGLDKVYGTPITQGDTTIVPVAEVRTGFGYGEGHDPDHEEGGSGGGAGVRLTPRGFIEMTDEGVRYRPIFSYTPLVVGGGFLAWLLYRFVSR